MARHLCLVPLAVFAVCLSGVAQTMPGAVSKYGVDAANTNKTTVVGPSNPVLVIKWTGIGATEPATFDGTKFWAPQGPLLRTFDPQTGAVKLVIDTSPGNASSVTHAFFDVIVHDADGNICDPNVNGGTCSVSAGALAHLWAGYGVAYLYQELRPPLVPLKGLFTMAIGGWRSIAPATLEERIQVGDTFLPVTGAGFFTIDGRYYEVLFDET